MEYISIEKQKCLDYIQKAEDEKKLSDWLIGNNKEYSLILSEGFEERSLGILEAFYNSGKKLSNIIISRYTANKTLNEKYRERFELLSEKLSPKSWNIIDNNNDGLWVSEALKYVKSNNVLLDITAISNRGIFNALDAAIQSMKSVIICYSEAQTYWPTKVDWEALQKEFYNNKSPEICQQESIAEIVNKKEWLFGYEHKVELIPKYEGYDSAGSYRALIGFLPFKSARLAAILKQEDYSKFLFIAGQPRLTINRWRLDAQKKINEELIKSSPVIVMNTFGYRNALKLLADNLIHKESFLNFYDVHLAIIGSKLQTIACWIFCNIIKSITVVTSIPSTYYPEAFSAGIGNSWVFKLHTPEKSNI